MTLNHLARVPEFLASKIRERVSRSLLTLVDYLKEEIFPSLNFDQKVLELRNRHIAIVILFPII